MKPRMSSREGRKLREASPPLLPGIRFAKAPHSSFFAVFLAAGFFFVAGFFAAAFLVPPLLPALAAIIAMHSTAILAGDFPGALLRIPGTPASAAYVDDAYQLTRSGRGFEALGIHVLGAAIGGVIGGFLVAVVAERWSPVTMVWAGSIAFGLVDLAIFLYPVLWVAAWPAAVFVPALFAMFCQPAQKSFIVDDNPLGPGSLSEVSTDETAEDAAYQ